MYCQGTDPMYKECVTSLLPGLVLVFGWHLASTMGDNVAVKLLVTLVASLIAYGMYKLSKAIYEELTFPIRDLPGPKSSSLLFGSLKELHHNVC
jgi:hypothetical protein